MSSSIGKEDGAERPISVVGADQNAERRKKLSDAPQAIEDMEDLRRAARGDERAVSRLYRQHVGRVHRTVARILGSSDPDVEDVVQKVFLAALGGADRFDGRSAVSTWLVGIASRRALDEARSRWRRGRWNRMTELVGIGRPRSAPDARSLAASEAERALATLNPDQRTAFVLYEVEGYTLKEISGMTGSGISTLHARLKAARKRLDAWVETQASESEGAGKREKDHDVA